MIQYLQRLAYYDQAQSQYLYSINVYKVVSRWEVSDRFASTNYKGSILSWYNPSKTHTHKVTKRYLVLRTSRLAQSSLWPLVRGELSNCTHAAVTTDPRVCKLEGLIMAVTKKPRQQLLRQRVQTPVGIRYVFT